MLTIDMLLKFIIAVPCIILLVLMTGACISNIQSTPEVYYRGPSHKKRKEKRDEPEMRAVKTPRERELERQYRELKSLVEAQMEDNAAAMETYRRLNEEAAKAAAAGKNRT